MDGSAHRGDADVALEDLRIDDHRAVGVGHALDDAHVFELFEHLRIDPILTLREVRRVLRAGRAPQTQ